MALRTWLGHASDRLTRTLTWSAPLAGLFALWLWSVFSAGSFQADHWLPIALVVALFGLVASVFGAFPSRLGGVGLVVATLFGAYLAWVGASTIWAGSANRVWLETARTGFLLLVFVLALLYLGDSGVRRSFKHLLFGSAAFILVAALVRLWTAPAIDQLFIDNRLVWPVSYPNNAAALFLLPFWPLLWMAASSSNSLWLRGPALGLATGLSGLVIMTQSRGAVYSLAISLVVMFLVSPIRLRTFVYLCVPALLLLYQFPILNRYWVLGPAAVGGALGARTLLVASLAATCAGTLLALLERRVPKGPTVKRSFGAIVLVFVAGSVVWGTAVATRDVGGPIGWVTESWQRFTGTSTATVTEEPAHASRFAVVSSSGRVDIWRVAWDSFRSSPLTGVGADNFVFRFDKYKPQEIVDAQHAHSIELQLLGETGIVGALLGFGAVVISLAALLRDRLSAGHRTMLSAWHSCGDRLHRKSHLGLRREPTARRLVHIPADVDWSWEMALVAALAYWAIHASVDWLWQMAAVAIPALLILAAGLAGADAGGSAAGHDVIEERGGSAGRRAKTATTLFRVSLLSVSLVTIVMSGMPYLAGKYQESALALASTDAARAAARAATAHLLQPTSPDPFITQAGIYTRAAALAAESDEPDRAGATLDALSLGISSFETAIREEPVSWSLHYHAGVEILNLLFATQEATGSLPSTAEYRSSTGAVPGLGDWSGLASLRDRPLPAVGEATGSLALDSTLRATAARYRAMSEDALVALAAARLQAARQRNPLSAEVGAALTLLGLRAVSTH